MGKQTRELWLDAPQARKRHININYFSYRWPQDDRRFVPGTPGVPVCPWDKPRSSPYFTQCNSSLSGGRDRFVPGTGRGRRAAEKVYVLNVYVPLSLASFGQFYFLLLRGRGKGGGVQAGRFRFSLNH